VTAWTPERDEKLKTLKKEGLSASEIAARIGGGLSRNAVLGRAHRLGLCDKFVPKTRYIKPRPARTPPVLQRGASRDALASPPGPFPARPVSDALLEPDPAPEERVRLHDLRPHHCRWPIGDPREEDFRFCGRKRVGPRYCETHERRARQPLWPPRSSP
jgi:GcrA cell cycle regulator